MNNLLHTLAAIALCSTTYIKAMESNNNNNAPQKTITMALLSDTCPSEQQLNELKKIKAALVEWHQFSQKKHEGFPTPWSRGSHHKNHLSVSFTTHEIDFEINWRSDSTIYKIGKDLSGDYGKKPLLYCPIITINNSVLNEEISYKINVYLTEYMETQIFALNPGHSWGFKNSIELRFTNLFPESKKPVLRDPLPSVVQIIADLDDYINSCIKEEYKKTLSHLATIAYCAKFNPTIIADALNSKIPWESLEKILTDLPQNTFNLHALQTLIPIINEDHAPDSVKRAIITRCVPSVLYSLGSIEKQILINCLTTLKHHKNGNQIANLEGIIINYCLPPRCLEADLILPCLRLLPRDRQINCITNWLKLEEEILKTFFRKDTKQIMDYLIDLAAHCTNPEDKFICLAVAYIGGFIKNYHYEHLDRSLEQFPFTWHEIHGQEAWTKFKNENAGLLGNNFNYAVYWYCFIKKLATQPSGVNPGLTILDTFAIQTLREISLDQLQQTEYIPKETITFYCQVIQLLSPQVKEQYSEIITYFMDRFGNECLKNLTENEKRFFCKN